MRVVRVLVTQSLAWIKGYQKYSNNAGLYSAAMTDVLPIQNIKGSAKSTRQSRRISVSACGLFGFPLKLFMHSSSLFSSSLHIFPGDDFWRLPLRRTDRLTLARPRFGWTSSTDWLISLPKRMLLFLHSIVTWIVSEIDDAEVDLYSVYVVKCRVSHPLHSSSFLATMRPLRCAASIWPSSILNSVNASSTSCCVNLSPQVISECLNLKVKWQD